MLRSLQYNHTHASACADHPEQRHPRRAAVAVIEHGAALGRPLGAFHATPPTGTPTYSRTYPIIPSSGPRALQHACAVLAL